jgi:tRNA (guanosine-2'-O-)-methyltransferase
MISKQIEILGQFISDERRERIERVLSQRTRSVTLVLDNVHDPHNQAACLRSAEALGIQDVHLIVPEGKFKPHHKIARGTDHWLDVLTHESAAQCMAHLKSRGYLVAGGALGAGSVSLMQIDFTKPVALVLGNEHEGLSGELLQSCDILYRIPMIGFVESFNVSVSAAISLFHAVTSRAARLGSNGDLTADQKQELRQRWYHQSVGMADEILARAVAPEGE